MSTPEEPDWVRQGTPRDVDAEWNDEQSEYGTSVSPVEWDDYSSEQSVPVERPRPVVQPPAAEPDAPVDREATDQEAAGPAAETSDDAALLGAPLEDQPVLVANEQPGAEETGEEPLPGTDVPDAGGEGFERPAEGADEESLEEASLDEPSIDDYDEPHDDEPVTEPVEDLPVEEDAPVLADEAAAEEAPAPREAPEEEVAVEESAEDEAYDPDATRVSPAVGADPDATDETAAGDEAGLGDDPDATRVVPVAVGAAGVAAAAGASPVPDDLYRTGETVVIDDREALAARAREADEAEARERELQAQLDAERRARDERLGVVATSSENELRDPATAYKVSTDRFFGSLGLFVLRLVTAAVLGVTGYQVLTNVDRTADFLSQTAIPEPRLVTWIVGFTLGTLALLLVIGLVQRAVGVVLLLLSIGSLVFIRWGSFSPFVEGREGFLGDKTLLLAAIGFVLIGVGGGLWGVDGAFRRARAAARAEKS